MLNMNLSYQVSAFGIVRFCLYYYLHILLCVYISERPLPLPLTLCSIFFYSSIHSATVVLMMT